jgi:hypothetical protein
MRYAPFTDDILYCLCLNDTFSNPLIASQFSTALPSERLPLNKRLAGQAIDRQEYGSDNNKSDDTKYYH